MAIERAADIMGAGSKLGARQWRAWRCHGASTGAGWLLFCPGAHAAWSYWWVMLTHLRVEPGLPAPITTPGAGWEIVCFAQQPDIEPNPDDAKGTLQFLEPIDWVVQFAHVKDDAAAAAVLEQVVRWIMTGQISPDSDHRRTFMVRIPEIAMQHAERSRRSS